MVPFAGKPGDFVDVPGFRARNDPGPYRYTCQINIPEVAGDVVTLRPEVLRKYLVIL